MEKIIDDKTCWIRDSEKGRLVIRYANKRDEKGIWNFLFSQPYKPPFKKETIDYSIEHKKALICKIKKEVIAIGVYDRGALQFAVVHTDFHGLKIYPAIAILRLVLGADVLLNEWVTVITAKGEERERLMRTLDKLGKDLGFKIIPKPEGRFVLEKKEEVSWKKLNENSLATLDKLDWHKGVLK